MSQFHSKSGLTLVELIIVTVMLAFIALGTFGSIRSTFQAKRKVDQRTEVLQESRAVTSIFDRDLRAAYFVSAEDMMWDPRKKPQDQEEGDNRFVSEEERAFSVKPNPITVFQGQRNNLFFSSKSHQRRSANALENNAHFVLYQLKGDQLTRSESKRAVNVEDRENPDIYESFVLLSNVRSLQFSYWNKKSQKWDDRWDSERKEQLNMLPDAVKIEITYQPDLVNADKRADKVADKQILTAVRLTEAAFRNIDWKKDRKEKLKQEKKNNSESGRDG